MPVEPHLDRVGKVGAHLDEGRPEVLVPDVEVEAGHPPIGLGERVPHLVAGVAPVLALIGGEDVLVLLRDPDRGHPRTAGRGLPGQMRAHHLLLAVGLGEFHDRDLVGFGEGPHAPTESGAELLHDRRRGDRVAQMPGHEPDHLPRRLQLRDIAVEIDPIQTLQIKRHVPIEKIVHRQRLGHHHSLRAPCHPRQPQTRRSEAKPHWWCVSSLADYLGEGDASAADLGEDGVGRGGPDERLGLVVVDVHVLLDLGDQVGHGGEASAA